MSATVNKPTNPKEREADVNRKLQIYGIISAFQNGKVPSVSVIGPLSPFRLVVLTVSYRTTRSMSR